MVYAAFEVNQNYIATTLCENKARPWMHCNGQCYLMKKIKATEEKEKKQEEQKETEKDKEKDKEKPGQFQGSPDRETPFR